jgi:hypothetical protein
MSGREPVRRPGHEVLAPVTFAALDLSQRSDRLLTVRRALLLSGELLLQHQVPACFAGSAELSVSHRAVRAGNRDGDATIHARSRGAGMLFGRGVAVLGRGTTRTSASHRGTLLPTGLARRGRGTSATAPNPASPNFAPPHRLPSRSTVICFPAGNRNDGFHRRPELSPDRERAMLAAWRSRSMRVCCNTCDGAAFSHSCSVFASASSPAYGDVVHPHAATPVLATLFQGGVPHRPANGADGVSELGLLGGEREPVLPSGQHRFTASSAARRSV